MNKYICIHGHFYQPPRENPWLEAVEWQDSAAPFHDWNERVASECYAPNAYARLLDGDDRIDRIVSNYSKMSFDFGPTLLMWLQEKMPEIHQSIVDADAAGRQRFSGHGPALAQCYNHIIMPLANPRDKYTQTHWGIRDFEHRFGRKPEGMWLPETAADSASLDSLAEQGIQFTILSPYQASRVRPLKGGDWRDVNGARIDTSMPYLIKLPSGRSITAFFYDAPIARAAAFEGLLLNGENLARRMLDAFSADRPPDQLANIATDGESYGHHCRYGDMALAYALHAIEGGDEAKLTIYGEYLETHPPTHEVEIHQGSAWSCSHGVDRWRRNCGCSTGAPAGWNQNWREPLRQAFDWLRDRLAPRFETEAAKFLKDPWAARNDYISVILDRSSDNFAAFFNAHGNRPLDDAAQTTALRLLELQRHALLMYTSCGWFFNEISGLETVQVIQYAARAIQLAADVLQEDLEPEFLNILGKARSNIPEHRDGRLIYEKFVKPAIMTRETAGAHYAISSLFESYPETARIYSFSVRQDDRQLFTAGLAQLALGRLEVKFEITRSSEALTYCVLHMGEHNLNCAVRHDGDQEAYLALVKDAHEAFEQADFAGIIRLMDGHFGKSHYSLRNLFRDEQNKVVNQILATSREEFHNAFRLISDRYAPLMRILAGLHMPSVKNLALALEVVLNSELRRQFEGPVLDLERIHSLLAECEATKVTVERDILGYAFKGHLDRLSEQISKTPEDPELLERFAAAAGLVHAVPFEVNLWKPQNTYYGMLTAILPEMRHRAASGDEKAKTWDDRFLALGEQLGFHIRKDNL